MNLGYNIRRMVHRERVAAFARLSVLLISQDRNRGKRVFSRCPSSDRLLRCPVLPHLVGLWITDSTC